MKNIANQDNYLTTNLQVLFKLNKLKQVEIAELIGENAHKISNWKSGKTEPNLNQLQKLSLFFDMSVDDLLNFDLAKASEKYIINVDHKRIVIV